jgi:hypothetical protein
MSNLASLVWLAAWGLVASSGPVNALPIALAVVTFIGFSGTAAVIAANVLVFAVGLGLQMAARSLMKPKRPVSGGTTGKLQASGTIARTIPVGQALVTHSLVYANTAGSVGKTPNAFLYQVMSLADLPVAGLAEIWVNGSKVTWTATSGTQVGGGNGIEVPEYPGHMWIRFYDGTQTSADPLMVSLFSSDLNRPYSSSRVGTGVAYVVVVTRLNQEYFSGFPQFKFVVNGVRCYDPRFDTTAGGSGAQRWDDRSTWSASPKNPIVQAYNVMRGMSFGSTWMYGGQTIAATQLPISAWAAAMNECDAPITLLAGGAEPQFSASGEISIATEPRAAVQALLSAANGRMAESGGVFKPKVGAVGAAVFSITDADILTTEGNVFAPFRSFDSVVNAVNARYVEPREGWNTKDAPIRVNLAYEAQDGGRRAPADLSLEFVTSATQVQRLQEETLKESRRERRHTLPLPPDAFPLEPLDVISWTSPRNGYVSKMFRVDVANDLANLNVGLVVSEVDPSDYSWVPATDERPISITSTAPFITPSQPIVDWNASAIVVRGRDGSELAGIRMTWDGDIEDVDGVQFEVWDAPQAAVIYEGSTDRYERGAVDITANIRPETAYRVRGRYRPASNRPVSWSGYISVTTASVRTVAPGSLQIEALAADLFNRVDMEILTAESAFERLLVEVVPAIERNTIFDQQVTAGAFTARVRDEVGVVANDLGATAQRVSTVEAQQTDPASGNIAILARVVTEEGARATADSALASRATNLEASVNDPTSGLAATRATATNAASAASTADGKAVAAQNSAVTAQSTANSAQSGVTANQAAIATTNSAVASLTASTNAAFGGNVAGTTARFASYSNAGITESGYQLLAFNTLNGVTYSVGLTAYAGPAGRGVVLGGAGASVDIVAQNFRITDAGINGGVPTQLFTISGGFAEFAIPLRVTELQIAEGAFSTFADDGPDTHTHETGGLFANFVINDLIFDAGGSGLPAPQAGRFKLCEITLTGVPQNQPVIIQYEGSAYGQYRRPDIVVVAGTGRFYLFRGSTELRRDDDGSCRDTDPFVVRQVFIDRAPSGGTITYSLWYAAGMNGLGGQSGGVFQRAASGARLIAFAAKR